jgi:hypothetical protein
MKTSRMSFSCYLFQRSQLTRSRSAIEVQPADVAMPKREGKRDITVPVPFSFAGRRSSSAQPVSRPGYVTAASVSELPSASAAIAAAAAALPESAKPASAQPTSPPAPLMGYEPVGGALSIAGGAYSRSRGLASRLDYTYGAAAAAASVTGALRLGGGGGGGGGGAETGEWCSVASSDVLSC